MTLDEKNNAIKVANEAAKKYCQQKGMSLSKLNKQSCFYLGEIVCFAQRVPATGRGLVDDMSSQPKPTLIYNIDAKTIEPTDYTALYLK